MSEPDDLAELLDLAERAARLGGLVVRARNGTPTSPETKGTGDYVTDVDRASERAITELLAGERPDIPILGEEEGGAGGPLHWAVDPLDGTTNYLHGFPVVGVSVALVREGRPIVGVVHSPLLGETYRGARRMGATVDRGGGEKLPIRVSTRSS